VAGVLDRCTRPVVIGWAFEDTLAATLPLAALDMALKQRQPPVGLVHHSDRGVQYDSAAYRQRAAGGRHSKHEPPLPFATRAQACAAIFEWNEVFYNRTRFYSALGFKSPVDFETQLN
jgi:transposase InsO family protein